MAPPTSAVRAALRLEGGAARLAIPHDSERCRTLLLRLLRDVVAFVRQQELRQPPAKSLLWIHAVTRVCESRIEQLTRSDDVAGSWSAASPREVVTEAMVRELLVSLASIRLAETEAMVLDEVENVETLRHLQLTLRHEEATLRRIIHDGAGEDAQLRELQSLLREEFLQELAQTRAKTLADSIHNEASLQFAWETIQEQKKEIVRLRAENEQHQASRRSRESEMMGGMHEQRRAEPALAIHELQRQLAVHPNGNIRVLEDQVARLELEMARQSDLQRSVSGVTLDSSREDADEGRRGSMLLPSHLTTSAYRRECDQCRLQTRKLVECQSEVKQLRVQAAADQDTLVAAEKERVQLQQEISTLTQALLTGKQTQEELRRMIAEVSSDKLKLQTLYETTEMKGTRQVEELTSQVPSLKYECERLKRDLAEYEQVKSKLTIDLESIQAAYSSVETELKTVTNRLQDESTARIEAERRVVEEQKHAKEYKTALGAMTSEMATYRTQLNNMVTASQHQQQLERDMRTQVEEAQMASEVLHRKVQLLEEAREKHQKEYEALLALSIELQDQLHEKDASIAERDNTISHLSRDRQHEKTIAQALNDQLRECERRLEQSTRRIAELEGRVDLSEEQRSTLRSDIDALRRRAKETEEERGTLEIELKEQYDEIARLELALATEQQAHSRLQQQLMTYEEERVRRDQDLREKESLSASAFEKANKLSAEVAETKTTILMWMGKYHALADEKNKLDLTNDALVARGDETEAELYSVKQELAESVKQVRELRASLSDLQQESSLLEDKTSHLESIVSELSKKTHDLEEAASQTEIKHAEDIINAETSLSKATEDGNMATLKLQAIEKELSQAHDDIAGLRACAEALTIQIHARESSLETQSDEIERMTTDLQARQELINELQREVEGRQDTISAYANRCDELQHLLERSEAVADALQAEIARLRNELEVKQMQISDFQLQHKNECDIATRAADEVSMLRSEKIMLTEELQESSIAYFNVEKRLSDALAAFKELEMQLVHQEYLDQKLRDRFQDLLATYESDSNRVWKDIDGRLVAIASRIKSASVQVQTTTAAVLVSTRMTETALMSDSAAQTVPPNHRAAMTQTDDKGNGGLQEEKVVELTDHFESADETNPDRNNTRNGDDEYLPDFEMTSDVSSAESLLEHLEDISALDDNRSIEKTRLGLVHCITAFDLCCRNNFQLMESTLHALDIRLRGAVEKTDKISVRKCQCLVVEDIECPRDEMKASGRSAVSLVTPISHFESAWVQTEPPSGISIESKVDAIREVNPTESTLLVTKTKRTVRLKAKPKPAVVIVPMPTKKPSHMSKGVQTIGEHREDTKVVLVGTRWSMLVQKLLDKSSRCGFIQLFKAHLQRRWTEVRVANLFAGLALRLLALSGRRIILRTAIASASRLQSRHFREVRSVSIAKRLCYFAQGLMKADKSKKHRTSLASIAEQLHSKIKRIRDQKDLHAIVHKWQLLRWRILCREYVHRQRQHLMVGLRLMTQLERFRRAALSQPASHVEPSKDAALALNDAVRECVVMLRRCCIEQTEITRRIQHQQSLLADGASSSALSDSCESVDARVLIELLLECSEQLIHWKETIDTRLREISVRESQLNRLEMHCSELQVLVDKYEKRHTETERRAMESKALAKFKRERRQWNERNIQILEGVISELQKAKQVRAALHERLERRTRSLRQAERRCQALTFEQIVFRAFYHWRLFTLSKSDMASPSCYTIVHRDTVSTVLPLFLRLYRAAVVVDFVLQDLLHDIFERDHPFELVEGISGPVLFTSYTSAMWVLPTLKALRTSPSVASAHTRCAARPKTCTKLASGTFPSFGSISTRSFTKKTPMMSSGFLSHTGMRLKPVS